MITQDMVQCLLVLTFMGQKYLRLTKCLLKAKGQKIEGAICEWISNDTLLAYSFKSHLDQPKDTFPVKTQLNKVGDFIVKTIVYGAANSGGLNSSSLT